MIDSRGTHAKRRLARLTSMPVLPPVPYVKSWLKVRFKTKIIIFRLKIALFYAFLYQISLLDASAQKLHVSALRLRTINNFSIVTGIPRAPMYLYIYAIY